MKSVRPASTEEIDEQLRELAEQLTRMDQRLRRLERQVAATTPRGWECTVCERGWVSARGGVLSCNRCSFRRHL
ncbi:hypothetical protein [Natronoarchaeum philippinense]|uniref:hypothetical protein n=1 Tax=Natronoarchaeum philippinense TaxID=558529 RepID=UPI00117F0AC4|nr:hypothetical protein [Natronoarchaeum philippinense]